MYFNWFSLIFNKFPLISVNFPMIPINDTLMFARFCNFPQIKHHPSLILTFWGRASGVANLRLATPPASRTLFVYA